MADLRDVLEAMIEKIENSDGKWIKPFSTSFPTNYKTKTTYSGINVLNLWMISEENGYTTNYYLTYNQIKDLGGFIKAGEKASDVFFFKPIEFKDEETDELKTIPLLKSFKVFNIDQTSLELEQSEIIENPNIEEFIKNTGIEIRNSAEGAYYMPRMDYIGIPNKAAFKSTEYYYATLLHELAHSTGHKKRLDRDMTGSFGSESYAKEELIAETTRVFLQVFLGLNNTEMEEHNAAYLKGWLKPLKENPKGLWKIFSEAQKAFDFLIQK